MIQVKNNKGETIVETLAAILIVALCFLMIQNSVVTSARINENTKDNNMPFNTRNIKETKACTITIKRSATSGDSTYQTTCKKAGDYWYYE